MGVERVRGDHVGAGVEVLGVDAADQVRLGQAQQVVGAGQRRRPVGEALAADVGLACAGVLDHGPHGPVEDQDAAAEPLAERVGRGHGRGLRASPNLSRARTGRS